MNAHSGEGFVGGTVSTPRAIRQALKALPRTMPDTAAFVGLLFEMWLSQIPEARAAASAFYERRELLPWWAKPGRAYITSDGTFVGPVTRMPAIQGVAPPEGSGQRQVRPSAYDLNKWFEQTRSWGSEKRMVDAHESRLAQLEERLAAQTEEEIKIGLPPLRRRMDITLHLLGDITYKAMRLGPAPCRRAFAIILKFTKADLSGDRTLFSQINGLSTFDAELFEALEVLKDILPVLTGKLREVAGRLAKPDGKPFKRMPFFIPPDPNYVRGRAQ